jgi:predicted dehydrogenase
MTKFNVALLGTGTAAKEHVKGWLSVGADVVATAGPDAPCAELQAVIPNAAHFEVLPESMAKSIDAVDICTPHHLHIEQLAEMKDWPVAILVEKPIVTRPTHLKVLQGILRNRAYPVLMRTNKRFERHVMAFMAASQTWDAHHFAVQVNWRQRPEYMAKRRWYRCCETSGGGVVLGMGIHFLDILRELSKDITVDDAILRTFRCSPNKADTTSENYARVRLSSPRFNVAMKLSAWKPHSLLPEETIVAVGQGATQSFRRDRKRDATAELTREFDYYRSAVMAGRFHPEKQAMIDVHRLAFAIYDRYMERD